MRVAVDHEFARRHVVMADFLFDAGDAPTGGHQQRSGVGVQPALKQREHSGFTCAVLAYDTDALAGIEHKIGAVHHPTGHTAQSTEERRVGQEVVSPYRLLGWTY